MLYQHAHWQIVQMVVPNSRFDGKHNLHSKVNLLNRRDIWYISSFKGR